MQVVLLSGGAGHRLWPMTTKECPKQFLKVLKDPYDRHESMIQRLWRQLNEAGMATKTIISTNENQVPLLLEQLPDQIPLLVEPERRDTFPAIALASAYLISEGAHLDEIVIILPVDCFVDSDFFSIINQIEQVLNEPHSSIALVGIQPTHPSSNYGYIIPADNIGSNVGIGVCGYREKPSESEAITLLQQNAFWNSGVFAFRLKFMKHFLEHNRYPIDFYKLRENYSSLPLISFDYHVMEKLFDDVNDNKYVTVIPYKGKWKDLGTWSTLTEEMEDKIQGNCVVSSNCTNTHIINEMDTPVVVLGVANIVIAVSHEGILVMDKTCNSNIKEILIQRSILQ